MFARLKAMFSRSPAVMKPLALFDCKAFIDEVDEARRYTPDLPQLEGKEWHWLFSYDETQKGHHQEALLLGAEKYEFEGFTQQNVMALKYDLGIFSKPLVFLDDLGYQNHPPLIKMKGELYKVEPRRFLELDKYLMNTVSCFRREVQITVPFTHLYANDRHHLEQAITRKKPRKIILNGETVERHGAPIQSNTIRHDGVWRVKAWMYFADKYYWEDLIRMGENTHPVLQFENPKGVIKNYYRFTDEEYKGGEAEHIPF